MKAMKCFCKFIFALSLLILILGSILVGILTTEKGQQWVFQTAVHTLEQLTNTKIEIHDYAFSFPLDLELKNVVISQEEQPILSIQKFSLCCDAAPLFQGKIAFSKLYASNITLLKLPRLPVSHHEENALFITTPLLPLPPLPLPRQDSIEHVDLQKIKIHLDALKALNLNQEINLILYQDVFNHKGDNDTPT